MIHEDLRAELARCAGDEQYRLIPETVIEALHRYVYGRVPPGSFVTAVLSNNLKDAVARADARNVRVLREIVTYCYMELPAVSWGSGEKVAAWLNAEVA